MSGSQRVIILLGALVLAVAAFLVARPGDEEEPQRTVETTPTQTDTGEDTAEPQPTTEEEPAPPPEPAVTRINIRGGSVAGGPKTIEAAPGDSVRIVVRSDAPDEIHLHGYDITRTAAPGEPARFRFKADAEGAFEMESHTAEDAGLEPLVARVVVAPS